MTSMATEWKARLPHARGGVSKFGSYHVRQQGSSPRTWGCFWSGPQTGWRLVVFPTHVGVFLNSCLCRQSRVSLPHARGGVSLVSDLPRIPWESSPRTWGCFFHILHIRPLGKVFPTHVGVFLPFCLSSSAYACLPHARGGVSSNILHSRNRTWSSPRTWGCFCSYLLFARLGLVFPTHVGVFPISTPFLSSHLGLPHARGGVSVF